MSSSYFLFMILFTICISPYQSARIAKSRQNTNKSDVRSRNVRNVDKVKKYIQKVVDKNQNKEDQVHKKRKAKQQKNDSESSYESIEDQKQGIKLRSGTLVNKSKVQRKVNRITKSSNKIDLNDNSIVGKLNQLKSFDSIKYLNVGQGNGIIAKTKDETFVFDLGTTSKMYLQEIIDEENSPQNIQQKIQTEIGSKQVQFFLTHNDYDHYSMKNLIQIKNFHVSPFVKVRQSIIHPKLEIVKPQTIYYDKVLVLNSPNIEHGTTNDNSVIFVIKVQGKVFILTGDATARSIGMTRTCQELTNPESANEAKTLQALRELAPYINYFTYPHHGTQTDGSYCVFEEIAKLQHNLEGVIISAGVQRIYKHPSQDSIERVKSYYENKNKKQRSKKYLRFQYFQKPTFQPLDDSSDFKHILNKDKQGILLGYTNVPLFITASLGDITFDKKGLYHSFSYECKYKWELVQYESFDVLDKAQKINKKILSQLQKNVCGYVMCYSQIQILQNYTVLNEDKQQNFKYNGTIQQIKEEYKQHQKICMAKNGKVLI